MSELDQYVVGVVILFCRIGACLSVAAGFSSARIPVRVRLFLALALTLALAPTLLGRHPEIGAVNGAELVRVIVQETLVGLVLGLSARVFLWALHFMATAITTYIGLSGIPGASVDDGEPAPGLAALVGAMAVVLVFVADLHWKLLAALIDSYELVRPGQSFALSAALERHVSMLSLAFVVCAQIAGPFFAFSLIVNLVFGLVNKMVPQIPAYFISIPFILAGGLFLFYFVLSDLFKVFLSSMEASVAGG